MQKFEHYKSTKLLMKKKMNLMIVSSFFYFLHTQLDETDDYDHRRQIRAAIREIRNIRNKSKFYISKPSL